MGETIRHHKNSSYYFVFLSRQQPVAETNANAYPPFLLQWQKSQPDTRSLSWTFYVTMQLPPRSRELDACKSDINIFLKKKEGLFFPFPLPRLELIMERSYCSSSKTFWSCNPFTLLRDWAPQRVVFFFLMWIILINIYQIRNENIF